MNESETKATYTDEKKRKIRERYKGVDPNSLIVIPAKEKINIRTTNLERRVAVYARVSTDDPNQTSSYELQKNHYTDVVNNHPNWTLVKIYADEGISGTSLQHRDSFIEMIRDCELGKIDMIVTKSVSRFARNIVDCIKIERDLKKLKPPVGILFETENIFTLDEDSEVLLSIMAMMAQEESHTKSEIMNASIEMRFKRGIFLTPTLLGYDHDAEGNLVVNEDEAKIVRLIFYMYLDGYSCQEIADTLTNFGRSTKKGNTIWSPTSILQILQNERHCGDVTARKTWTPSYLDHKSVKNKNDLTQYRAIDHHEPIISHDDFIAVQRLISNAKYGNKGFLPELLVIQEGVLKGYVTVNPRWAGFTVADYYEACDAAGSTNDNTDSSIEVQAKSGDFDLRGYEVARSQFFNTTKVILTFSDKILKFNTIAVKKFGEVFFVELLLHPRKRSIVIRACKKENRNHIEWGKMHNGKMTPKIISGTAFLPTIYELFELNPEYKYRLVGQYRGSGSDALLYFDLEDAEAIIPTTLLEQSENTSDITPITGGKNNITAYPEGWSENFGENFYLVQMASGLPAMDKVDELSVQSIPYKEPELNPTDAATRQENINKLLTIMKQEKQNDT